MARPLRGLPPARLPVDRYVVIGNPIAHSLSPEIHARFAEAEGERLEYGRMLVEPAAFARDVRAFFDGGGRGANVTLPFKLEAFALADVRSERAQRAGAANFLAARDGRIEADNTDGAGLVADLERNAGITLAGRHILILGAGGATRGVVGPLLQRGPRAITIANRTRAKADALRDLFEGLGDVRACGLDAIPREVDVVINGTSASTLGDALALPPGLLRAGIVAYDMAYGKAAQPFLAAAREAGAIARDGLGMLVEQAAESFELWRGRRPDTAAVLAALRARFA